MATNDKHIGLQKKREYECLNCPNLLPYLYFICCSNDKVRLSSLRPLRRALGAPTHPPCQHHHPPHRSSKPLRPYAIFHAVFNLLRIWRRRIPFADPQSKYPSNKAKRWEERSYPGSNRNYRKMTNSSESDVLAITLYDRGRGQQLQPASPCLPKREIEPRPRRLVSKNNPLGSGFYMRAANPSH